jgi:catechol 2,3-dioxygenase-like lactoylglutathione lyase family enzyme
MTAATVPADRGQAAIRQRHCARRLPERHGTLLELDEPEAIMMFAHTPAFSSFSAPDLAKVKRFYRDTLGLEVAERPEGLELKLDGGGKVFIYQSSDYTAPEHTVLNFVVDDVERAVAELGKKGVRMEQYDWPEIKTDSKGIFRGEQGPKAIAWFKDPADHILAVLQER